MRHNALRPCRRLSEARLVDPGQQSLVATSATSTYSGAKLALLTAKESDSVWYSHGCRQHARRVHVVSGTQTYPSQVV